MSAKPETFLRLAAAMMKLKMQGFRPANYDVRVPEDAPCSFPRDQKTARVQCGPSELAYSLETGDFSGAAPDSRVADLAGRLMDHVEAVRFADRKEYRGTPLPSKSALEKLRKAGYVQ